PVQCSALRACALPLPPNPVGHDARSRARPPTEIFWGPVQCSALRACALPMPPDPVGHDARSRARPPFSWGLALGVSRLAAELPALLVVVAAVEHVPFAAAGDDPLWHAGPGQLVETAIEREH